MARTGTYTFRQGRILVPVLRGLSSELMVPWYFCHSPEDHTFTDFRDTTEHDLQDSGRWWSAFQLISKRP